jgi:hypothetical protein
MLEMMENSPPLYFGSPMTVFAPANNERARR